MLTSSRRLIVRTVPERLDHDPLELVVDLGLVPEVAVEVLHPLEVADGHAAGVAQDVRDQEDAVLEEDRVGLGRRRAVGRLGDDPGLDPAGVALGDLVLERGRDQDVAGDLEDLGVGDVGRAGEALDRAVLGLPGDRRLATSRPLRIVDPAGRVADGDDGRALLADQPGRDRAGVAEALDGDASPCARSSLRWRGRLDDAVDGAPGRRLVAALGAAEGDRLAGDHAGHRVADVHRVGVHDPGHRLAVRVHVRRGDVPLGPDDDADLGRVAAGQALELAQRELLGIDDDAALGAAVGDVDDRALPGHPHRQGLDLVEGHALVVADAALGRAAAQVVLDAIAGEDLDAAVVHLHREVDDQLAPRLAQDPAQAGIEVQPLGRQVELLLGHLPRVDRRAERLVRSPWSAVFLRSGRARRAAWSMLRVVSRTTQRSRRSIPTGPVAALKIGLSIARFDASSGYQAAT